jgi:hypothetical protein
VRRALSLHPDFQCEAVARLDVDIARPRAGVLTLSYVVTGSIDNLRLPPLAASERTQDLWKHTCFEAFARPLTGDGYFEFNFSPSTHWATYQFDNYREGMRSPSQASAPRFETRVSADRYELDVLLDLSRLAGLPTDRAWRLGVSAVIEEADGRKSYWALTHPPGKADFHHADGFSLELTP